jgi:hypothetical protein
MAKSPKDRLELEHRLRDCGYEPKLYQDDGQREAAEWARKKLRQGKLDATIDPRELGAPPNGRR